MLLDDLKILFLRNTWEKILEEKPVNSVCKYSFSLSSFVLIWILLVFCMEHALSVDVFSKSSSTRLKSIGHLLKSDSHLPKKFVLLTWLKAL